MVERRDSYAGGDEANVVEGREWFHENQACHRQARGEKMAAV